MIENFVFRHRYPFIKLLDHRIISTIINDTKHGNTVIPNNVIVQASTKLTQRKVSKHARPWFAIVLKYRKADKITIMPIEQSSPYEKMGFRKESSFQSCKTCSAMPQCLLVQRNWTINDTDPLYC